MRTGRFEGYIRYVLAPMLHPGQVVADNHRAHRSERARAAIEARGAQLWHLPAYSSDFSPIEFACAKLVQALHRRSARANDDLRSATWATLAAITSTDITARFTHIGYRPRDRRL